MGSSLPGILGCDWALRSEVAGALELSRGPDRCPGVGDSGGMLWLCYGSSFMQNQPRVLLSAFWTADLDLHS